MRTSNFSSKVLFGAVLSCALAGIACGPTLPPRELQDARAEYSRASVGPAASETPAQLHTAKTALDQAERAFADDGDKPYVRDKAYVALRKAQIADASARVQLAQKAKSAADLEAQQLQVDTLRRTQSDLQNSQQSLARTQDELDHEKKAREDAEKKHAQAMADLQKIASVKQENRGMVITLSGSVLFATNESTLLPAAVVKLNEVADALIKGNPDSNITIEGHTDTQGARDYNMQLGQRRAEAVKAQLVSRGVASDRINAVGVGPDRPVADNKSAEGRANNRRVEIVVEGGRGTNGANGSGGSNGVNPRGGGAVPTPGPAKDTTNRP
ncbi:MAG: outer membrane protein [Labilithrix sp.]|nr:outer membrane protein [Labilithrix sp.]